MRNEPIAFDDIIVPLTRGRFLSEFWSKSFLHLSGRAGRFTSLLPWEELNDILEWHCPPQPQLRLFQDGKIIEARRYIGGPIGNLRLDAGSLIANLSQGASMILDRVQEVAPRVSQLAETIQDIFQGITTVNLYAGWRKQKCFDLHWDPHDLIVLQLSGRKHWKVYNPTRVHPVKDDIEVPPKPSEQPVWDGILNDGDMLHVPRGWWHIAYPLDEPSLHLSIGIQSPSGLEFLQWWARKMLYHPEVRKNLPHGSNAVIRQEYYAGMRKLMDDGQNQDHVEEFLRDWNSTRLARPRVRLPFAPIEQQMPLSKTTRIRLATSQRLFIEPDADDNMAKFHADGTYWSIRREFIPVFERLSGQTSISFGDLCAGIQDQRNIAILMSALDKLANAGVIFKESSESSGAD